MVLVAAGDLEDALAHQRFECVATSAFAPLGDDGGTEGTKAEGRIDLREPGQAAIGGQAAPIEGGVQRQ